MTASSSANKPISTESLENAAKNIDSALQSDRQYSELDALLRNARHAGGTLVCVCTFSIFFPISCHLGLKIVLIRFVHLHKKYKTRVGHQQHKLEYWGILAQKVHPYL